MVIVDTNPRSGEDVRRLVEQIKVTNNEKIGGGGNINQEKRKLLSFADKYKSATTKDDEDDDVVRTPKISPGTTPAL
ncbi:hypothetical protein L3Y34_013158 [Caenorhabditis briggsae]|uniref:Uncharacterized protein n=1 Tax=Caenorhabditis briggsae TaxID=6238 RepID=A0AAE8ZW63_CAEBR|nr:hypothetical protein L3Y34_013158 [Caenorhabditis briggsae]